MIPLGERVLNPFLYIRTFCLYLWRFQSQQCLNCMHNDDEPIQYNWSIPRFHQVLIVCTFLFLFFFQFFFVFMLFFIFDVFINDVFHCQPSSWPVPCLPLCRLGPCRTISYSNTAITLAEWGEAPTTSPSGCRRTTGWDCASSKGHRHVFKSSPGVTSRLACRCCGLSSSTRNVAVSERRWGSVETVLWTSCLMIPCGTSSGTWWVTASTLWILHIKQTKR